ncbi:MAG: hypothetical protein H6728_13655 [Myxococcales bacterium]|nr:hypothetical protein [Myxococcales bacterium]MCB9644116.1 hypothetical protein [Myxococcales bacterium]
MLYRGYDVRVTRQPLGDGQRRFFEGSESFSDRLALRLCDRHYFPKKEFFEALYFSRYAQRRLKRLDKEQPWVALDIACGHGLIGMLLAAYVRADRLGEVWLIDPFVPERSGELEEIFAEMSPHSAARVKRIPMRLGAWIDRVQDEPDLTERRFFWMGCHACGELSDAIMAIAIARREPFLVMPCCPNRRWKGTWPRDLSRPVEADLSSLPDLGTAMDLTRLGRAQAAGYRTFLRTIDAEISPHNRILYGEPAEWEKKTEASGDSEKKEENEGED